MTLDLEYVVGHGGTSRWGAGFARPWHDLAGYIKEIREANRRFVGQKIGFVICPGVEVATEKIGFVMYRRISAVGARAAMDCARVLEGRAEDFSGVHNFGPEDGPGEIFGERAARGLRRCAGLMDAMRRNVRN
jgi:hypothetical protein